MINTKAAKAIEKLLIFAKENGLIKELDTMYSRNLLLDLLQVEEPCDLDDSYKAPRTAAPILNELLDVAVEKGLISDTITESDLFDTRIMNCVMPRPSEINDRFNELSKESLKDATDYFYNISNASEYIRRERVAKNIKWIYPDDKYGEFEVTINLSKPEKDPNEIKKLLTMPKSGYPACMLCAENMGYAGRLNHPARQTHRLLPFELKGERWYMQYSPYVYFNEHCIVLKAEHSPMLVCRDTFVRLIDYIERLPHYFIGSNAGLPIVGGSILNHDHYQGGRHELPMAKAKIKQYLNVKGHENVEAGVVNWPMNCIRLTSSDKNELIDVAAHVLTSWEAYSDEENGVVNSADDKHNAITPYARMRGDKYQIDLVLRNNLTSEKYPLGIYHPHPELHHIKKENIGLIEVMGLFILPGRLKNELKMIEDILTGMTPFDKDCIKQHEKLAIHLPWIEKLVEENGTSMNPEDVTALFQDEIGKICRKTLECSGVYKDTESGNKALLAFLEYAGLTAK